MNKTETNRDKLAELLPEAIVWDGFDDAIVGYSPYGGTAVYDINKMVEILMDGDQMEEEEALEYLEFNVFCAYVGEYTPIHIELL